MASTDARPVPRKNVAFRYYFAIRKNDGTLITTWAGMDSEVDKDGAGFTDCTNEATEIGTSGYGYIDLTSTEMNADAVGLKITVTNTSALPVVVTLFPEEVGDYRANVEQFGGTAGTFSAGRPEVNTSHWRGTAVSDPTVEGVPDVNVKTWNDLATVALPLVPSTPGRTLNLNVTGQADADVVMWDGESVATPDTAGYPKVTIKDGTGQGELDITSGVTKANTVEFGGMAGTFNAGIPEVKTNALSANTITADSIAADAGAELADALLDLSAGVETGLTLRQAIRLLVAANAGKLSGAATTTITIRNAVADDKNRITATVDEDGNRSAITYDLT